MEIKHLSKKFGKKQVLTDINYTFSNGVYGILGPNGAGKTTLMRCILNLYRYQEGSVTFSTEEGDIRSQDKIGYLPQKNGMFSGLTVEEQLMYFANLKNMDKSLWEAEITRVLQLVNLEEVRKKKGRKLSGGMVRRVGIAQALLNHPALVIFDEPTTGLDPEERIRFKNILGNLQHETIVLMSTHIVEDVEAVCDHVLVLKDGQLAAAGTQEEISRYADGKVYEIGQEEYVEGDYIEKEKEIEGKGIYRILTNRPLEGRTPETANIEDGYLCILKNI